MFFRCYYSLHHRRQAGPQEERFVGHYRHVDRRHHPSCFIRRARDDCRPVNLPGPPAASTMHANSNYRIIGGIGNGINTATAPVWQGETSKASWRGKLIVIEMILNIAGFSISNWVTYGFSFVGGSVAWRFPIAFQFFFIFILYGTTPWLPESPRSAFTSPWTVEVVVRMHLMHSFPHIRVRTTTSTPHVCCNDFTDVWLTVLQMAHCEGKSRRSRTDPCRLGSLIHRRSLCNNAVERYPMGRQLRKGELGPLA